MVTFDKEVWSPPVDRTGCDLFHRLEKETYKVSPAAIANAPEIDKISSTGGIIQGGVVYAIGVIYSAPHGTSTIPRKR